MAESADRPLSPCNPIPAQDRAVICVGTYKQKIRITVRLIRLFGGTPAGFSFPVPVPEGLLLHHVTCDSACRHIRHPDVYFLIDPTRPNRCPISLEEKNWNIVA